jgi:hypothetical protein
MLQSVQERSQAAPIKADQENILQSAIADAILLAAVAPVLPCLSFQNMHLPLGRKGSHDNGTSLILC